MVTTVAIVVVVAVDAAVRRLVIRHRVVAVVVAQCMFTFVDS